MPQDLGLAVDLGFEFGVGSARYPPTVNHDSGAAASPEITRKPYV